MGRGLQTGRYGVRTSFCGSSERDSSWCEGGNVCFVADNLESIGGLMATHPLAQSPSISTEGRSKRLGACNAIIYAKAVGGSPGAWGSRNKTSESYHCSPLDPQDSAAASRNHNLHLAFFYNHTSFLVKVYCFNFAYSRAFQASMSCIVVAVC